MPFCLITPAGQEDPAHSKILDAAEEMLGYRFQQRFLLESALTHPSASKDNGNARNYERLEFLGDSVLGCIVATDIYMKFPNIDEGGLTRIKVSLVSGKTLSCVAEEAGIADLIIFGESEMGTRGRGMHSALENVYEALVGALYLDGGIEPTSAWIRRTLGPYINEDLANEPESPKSNLQEHLQAQHSKPEYKIIEESGPPHDRIFTSAVYCKGEELGRGEGHSKKEAEAQAAAAALRKLGILKD